MSNSPAALRQALKTRFKDTGSDDTGLTLVEVLIAGLIGSMIISLIAVMFNSFVQSDRAARDTVDVVADTNQVSREFHQMIRGANAYTIRSGNRVESNRGRELWVEHADGTCETWVGLDNRNALMVLTGSDAEGFNKAMGNRGNLILGLYEGDSTQEKDRTYEGVVRRGSDWFSYAGSTHSTGIEFAVASVAGTNQEVLSNRVSPRSDEVSQGSSCW